MKPIPNSYVDDDDVDILETLRIRHRIIKAERQNQPTTEESKWQKLN